MLKVNKTSALITSFLTTASTLFITGCASDDGIANNPDVLKAKADAEKLAESYHAPSIDVVTLEDKNGKLYTVQRGEQPNEREAIYNDNSSSVNFLIDDQGNLLFQNGNQTMLEDISESYLASLGFLSPSLVANNNNQNLYNNSNSSSFTNTIFPFLLGYWMGNSGSSSSFAGSGVPYQQKDQPTTLVSGSYGGRSNSSSTKSQSSSQGKSISSSIKPSTNVSSSNVSGFSSAKGGFGGAGVRSGAS